MALLQTLEPQLLLDTALSRRRQPALLPPEFFLVPFQPQCFLLLLSLQRGPGKDRLWLRILGSGG